MINTYALITLAVRSFEDGVHVPYTLLRYRASKNCDKNKNLRILEKAHAFSQSILKRPVNFYKDHPKTVGGAARTRCIFPIHFCGIRALKKALVKNAKKKPKAPIKFQKHQSKM